MKFPSKRLLWPVLFGAAAWVLGATVGISRGNMEVVLFKFMIFCPSVVLVHLTRKTLFPYIDLEQLIYGEKNHQFGAAVLGIFLFYTILIYALTQAI